MQLQRHVVNQEYSKYIQPLNQNVFQIIESRLNTMGKSLKGAKVLDFGCNTGNLLRTAAGLLDLNNYTGIDVNKPALDIAHKEFAGAKFVYYNKFNCTFNQAGNKSEPFPLNEKFDVIVCYGVFTHFFMNEIKSTVEMLKKHLKPEGVLVFSVWEDVDYYGYLGFLDRELNINVQLPKPEFFNKGFVLADRKRLIVDAAEPDNETYTWVESFYLQKYVLESIVGSKKFLNGAPTKHPVYAVTA